MLQATSCVSQFRLDLTAYLASVRKTFRTTFSYPAKVLMRALIAFCM